MAGLCSSLAVENTDEPTTQNVMKRCCKTLPTLALALSLFPLTALAQTAGSARLQATLLDYAGTTSPNHYTVVWVTTQAGAFIKSLRKQGPSSWTSSEWGSHCASWNTARAGSTALDGYTTATAHNYTSETFTGVGLVTNSPIVLTWNGRDASNTLMPDGNYKFWIQYAENSGQGPVTTSGLLWTKGTAAATNTYANQGANFANMKVIWSPAATPPTITSVAPPATGIVGVPYNFNCTAGGTAPISFTAQGLPAGLTMSSAGAIAGNPTAAGTFTGTITAANGTLPNATQPFSIVVSVVTANIAAVQVNGNNLVLSGSGPANGMYTVLTAPSTDTLPAQWTAIATNSFDGAGNFSFTNAIDSSVPQKLYRLRVP
jgi:hypothetical protein